MNCVLTAAANANVLLSEAGMTVLIGLAVVFAALLLLTCIFWLFGLVARKGGNSAEQSVKAEPSRAPIVAPAPVVEDGVSDEVVAVIAAAIAAMSEVGAQYAIRRIRPAMRTNVRPVWAAAGIAENTQPF